jgi:beta-glucosidase
MAEDKNSKFPDSFLWGASVSSHQVEGGNHNQWTVWELENAPYLARNAEKHYAWLPVWPAIKKQAQDPNNYISGQAVDHYNRYKEDFDLVKKLNLNTLRFGIEWSRIEPTDGQWDEKEIEHYKTYIHELKKRGIQPVINLWHWTLPIWFAQKGGFAKRQNIQYFERFVKRIAKELIIPCGWVITVNEPNSYVGMSYLEGQWPPEKHRPIVAFMVVRNLTEAHRRVYKLLKSMDDDLKVGVATQCSNNQPKRPRNLIDKFVAGSANYLWNWWLLNRVRGCQDFVGFNYYFTDYYKGIARRNPHRHLHRLRLHTGHRGPHRKRVNNPPSPANDLGWYMEPSGIYHVIMQAAKRYKKPILITENGVADMHDKYRKWWIEETLDAVQRANAQGANVIGYFHWSLLDNFEWAQGWWPKFGLVAVDREDGMKRTIKPSGRWFAEFLDKQAANK